MKLFAKAFLPHLAAALLLLMLASLYFLPQLQGKVLEQPEITQYRGMAKEVRDYSLATGKTSLWTNSMFGGMPTYQINTISTGNNLRFLDRILRLGIWHPIGRFFAAMLCFYILMAVLGVDPGVGALAAVAFGLSTNTMILYETGHVSKVNAISYFPLIAAGLLLTYRRHYLWGGILFAVGLGLDVFSNHVQMTYYFMLTLVVYGIARLIDDIRLKQLPHFLKATVALAIAPVPLVFLVTGVGA